MTMMRRRLRSSLLATTVAPMLLATGSAPMTLASAAPLLLAAAPLAAQEVDVVAGSAWCDGDELCLDPDQLITSYRITLATDEFGLSASYEDECWPWFDPPPGSGDDAAAIAAAVAAARTAAQQPIAQRHGSGWQLLAEAYPLGLLDVDRISRFLRPFVGAGVFITGDGDPAVSGPGGSVVYGVKGRTDLIIAYGASLYLPSRDVPLRLVVQLRGTTMFANDVAFLTPGGQTVETEGSQNRTYAQLSVGFSYRLGGS